MSGIDCEEVLREVELYLDAELPEDRAAHVASHLRECSPCADRADFQQALREIVARKCGRAPAVPDAVVTRIRMVIYREEGPTTSA